MKKLQIDVTGAVAIYYLKKNCWLDFLDGLSKEYEIYLPLKKRGKELPCDFNFKLPCHEYHLEIFSRLEKEEIVYNEYRTVEPLRTFFSPPKERLNLPPPHKKTAIFGVKNCDLFSLKIQDYVFLQGEASDPFYKMRRENSLLIAGDCLAFKESCFCLALDINPFAVEGFDLNLSPLEDGFLVEAVSVKAMDAVKTISSLFSPATANQIANRDKKREFLVKRLTDHLTPHKIPPKGMLQDIVRKGYDAGLWQEEASRCVECGGCNLVCDTCHCFLLSEDRFGNAHERVRLWDACLYANFAKVAGGANPMKYRYQRLRNRYLKKFDFFPDNLGLAACCGCGRCIEVCPARIDIRKILGILAVTSNQ